MILRSYISAAAIGLAALKAASGAAVELAAWTIDGGGGALSGGGWILSGTWGQPDAGALTGGSFALQGGFWFGGLAATGVDATEPCRGTVTTVRPAVSPNPANPGASVRFALSAPAFTRVRVMDLRGSLVVTLLEGERPDGEHTVAWNGRDSHGQQVASGVYIVSVEADGQQATVRVTFVR